MSVILGGEHGLGQEIGKFLARRHLRRRGVVTNYANINPRKPAPEYLRSLQKLERVA